MCAIVRSKDRTPADRRRPREIGRHSPCRRRDSRFSRCYEERLDSQFACPAASVPSSEHRGWHTSLYRQSPSFSANVCDDLSGIGSVSMPQEVRFLTLKRGGSYDWRSGGLADHGQS